jgi:hypothetical protein
MPEAGESALIVSISVLPTSLHLVFGVSLFGAGNFMGVLRVQSTILHFLKAVGFSQSPAILPLLRRFRNVA